MTYKVGQILTSKFDVEVEIAITGEKVVIPMGNKIIIGPDKFAHHIRTGMIQPLGENAEIKGYDSRGIAEYLVEKLKCFPINEMLEDYNIEESELVDEIEYFLDDIGF